MPSAQPAPVMFVSHGGGPLPLLADPGHAELCATLQTMAAAATKPAAIVVISAHWEEAGFHVSSHAQPSLLYDYGGFPPAAYELSYAAQGLPSLAAEVQARLLAAGLPATLSPTRGFDHGVFVPLSIMYPQADIPVVCVSLNSNLDPLQHVALGGALAALRDDNILILGSGMSFHNMHLIFDAQAAQTVNASEGFNNWLDHTLAITSKSKQGADSTAEVLIDWQNAPHSRTCHPREEHLLPLHVCYGAAQARVERSYKLNILGVDSRCYIWQ